jgi:hypothetical protein
MEKKDEKKVLEMLTMMIEGYGQEASETRLEFYLEALKPYTLKDIAQALNQAVRSSEYLPVPATIIKHIEGDTDSQAIKAWETVIRAIEEAGNYNSVIVPRSIGQAIEQLGGWEYVSTRTWDELKWIRKDFIQVFTKRTGQLTGAMKMVGFHERSNTEGAYHEFIPEAIDYTGTKRPDVARIEDKTNNRKPLMN